MAFLMTCTSVSVKIWLMKSNYPNQETLYALTGTTRHHLRVNIKTLHNNFHMRSEDTAHIGQGFAEAPNMSTNFA